MAPRHIPTLLLPLPRRRLLAPLLFSRSATHIAEGRANKAAQGPGKRLGAKKASRELVVPGNIIFRQRGTHWFPGENCGIGRDHTIFAKEKGYVMYYRDEEKHPGRKYIGIVFEREMTLPRARNEARRRRLGLVGRPRQIGTLASSSSSEQEEDAPVSNPIIAKSVPASVAPPTPKKGYMYRPGNWEIGRAAEKAKITVPLYRAGNRFVALRKRKARRAAWLEKKVLTGGKTRGGKKKRKKGNRGR